MKRVLTLTMVVMLGSMFAFANITPPKTPEKKTPSKSIDTTLTIRLRSDAKEAKLIIPKSFVKQLRAELEQMDDGSDNTAAVTNHDFSRTQTIVSGMFLSLALVFGGIWFVRSGKATTKTTKTLVVVAAVSAFLSAATFVYANAGPPPEARSITGKMFSQAVHYYNFGSGAIKLETKADSDYNSVELIVPDPAPTPTPAANE